MTRARTGAGARGWLGVAGLCALTAAVWADVASSGVLARLDEPVLDADDDEDDEDDEDDDDPDQTDDENDDENERQD